MATPGSIIGTYLPSMTPSSNAPGNIGELNALASGRQDTPRPTQPGSIIGSLNPIPNTATPTTPPPASSSASSPPPAVYAPSLDLAALNAQARATAEGNTNPYYAKQLDDFLRQQSTLQIQKEQQYQTDVNNTDANTQARIKNLEDNLGLSLRDTEANLKDTLAAHDLTRQRTVEDVGTNQANTNQQQDYFQTDSGAKANTDRIALAKSIAQSGSTGGLGTQKLEGAQAQHNTDEARQTEKFQQVRDQQNLFQTRTFEDLLKADESAKGAAGRTEEGAKLSTTQAKEAAATNAAQTKAQAKFDLDAYIQANGVGTGNSRGEIANSSGANIKGQAAALEQQRLAAIAAESQNQSKLAFQKYLAGITNPAQYLAAVQTYGGSF